MLADFAGFSRAITRLTASRCPVASCTTLPADVRATEVAADDMWLALATVEEPSGLGGESGLVVGPPVHRKAPFEVGVDQFVGVQRR
ncbi:hypothetical protein ACWD26_25325 [Streptomyces sp. NPDC002787]